MKLDSIFKVRKYLEFVAKTDNQNTIQEAFKSIEGREAKSLFEILNNSHFLGFLVNNIEDDSFTKEDIRNTFKLSNSYYYL